MKVCPGCKAPLYTMLDEVEHEGCGGKQGTAKPIKPSRPLRHPTGFWTGTQDQEPVTPSVTHKPTLKAKRVTANVTAKHCPTCRCQRVYATPADRQRAYRLRKQVAGSASNGQGASSQTGGSSG